MIEIRVWGQAVVVLDDTDAESDCSSSDYSPRPKSISVLSKLQRNRLLPAIDDCVDFEKRRQRSQFDRNRGSQLSLCTTSSNVSAVDELDELTSSLNLGYDHQELKAQLLKRCGQTTVLPFDDVYSAR